MSLPPPPETDESDDSPTPAAEGLLAATLALMTAHAAPEPGARIGAAQQRQLMARKIVSNLFFLAHHPDLPTGLRRVVHELHARWTLQAGGEPAPVAADLALVLH